MTFRYYASHIVFYMCATLCLLAPRARAEHTEAQADPDSLPHRDTVEKIASWVRPITRPGNGKYVVLPKITHTSEAGLGFGVEVGRAFQWGGLYAADSDIRFTGQITLEGDGEASATLNLGWLDKKYTFKTKFSFDDIPRSYYGIGDDTPESNRETYERQSILYYIEAFRRITGHIRVGLRGELEDNVMVEVEEGGLLDSGMVPGANDATVVGGGLLVDYDSRERRFSPRHGVYLQFFWMGFESIGGQKFHFNTINADLRWYVPVRGADVLALQLFTYATDGQTPFWRMAAIGGRAHSRGYRKGRYLDKVMAAAQLEYRMPIWWRVGLVGIAGISEVASAASDLRFNNVRPTVGGGMRFLIGKSGGHARVDVAYGDSFHFYFSLDEAF